MVRDIIEIMDAWANLSEAIHHDMVSMAQPSKKSGG
jgi:hypothetical protein